MKIALAFAIAGFIVMTVGLTYGFMFGGGWKEVGQLWAMPWGKVTFVDVYVGLILFCAWIAHREKSSLFAAVWIAVVMLLGNWAACLYVVIALLLSKGDWTKFWGG